jgi:fumarate reductase subunit C
VAVAVTRPLEARYHRHRVPLLWWTKRRSYAIFMLRELSSFFVAVFIVELLLLVRAVARGPAAYEGFLDDLAHPVMVVVNVVALAFLLLHTITFANLTPRAMVVRLRGRRVPPAALLAGVYTGWLVVTALLAWLVVGG